MATALETNPRKQPRQARSRATVDAILTATAQVLVERGYDKTTTNVVARRAGVSIGSLYQYFPNKEALLTAVCELHMERTARLLLEKLGSLDDCPLADAIRTLVRVLLEVHAADPELHRVLIEQVPRLRGFEALQRMDRMFIEVVASALARRPERLRPTDLELAAFILVHSVQAIAHAAVLERPNALQDDALEDATVDLILRYLIDDP